MKFRSLIGGLGLLGILSLANRVEGQDRDTGYLEKSRTEILELLTHRAIVLSDSNFQQEIIDYDGAEIVLFYSSCPIDSRSINRKMEIVYLKLIDRFEGVNVNNLPLKFSVFDECKYVGNNVRTVTSQHITDLETHMYLDGREILRKREGPTNDNGPNDIDSIDSFVKAFDFLIRKNFTEFDGSTRYLVNEEGKIYKDSSP